MNGRAAAPPASGLQNRSFHFDESLAVQVFAYFNCHFMTKLQIAAYIGTAQVQITVLHADIVATVRIFLDGEGGVSDEFRTSSSDTMISISPVGICWFFAETFVDGTFNLDYEFTAQAVGTLAKFGIHLFVEH